MNDRRKQFPFDEIEPYWQRHWLEKGTFRALNPGDAGFDASQPKFYVLDMFPYPSGSGLHVGHAEGYTATDIIARYKRKQGFNVLHPMGWDGFGLPAEQYAIKTGQHPRRTTEENTGRFRRQLQALGFAYDWTREINTTDPEYFKWTQWIFLQLYNSYFDVEANAARPIANLEAKRRKEAPDEAEEDFEEYVDGHRLAYVAEALVNWCPRLGTVLANEEVKDGKSEVGGFPVERRPLRQWMLRITAYSQRLIDELEALDWPEGIKALQRNWIGRSEGAEVVFMIEGTAARVTVFTTRPDTLFGATYMVLAPEHPHVNTITTEAQQDAVSRYRREVSGKSDRERTELAGEKTGVFTGAFAINPVNEERIPVWIADYVLMGYGTGAIMAVPAHDDRDHEFALAFGLEIRQVVQPPEDWEGMCFSGEGTSIGSGVITGLTTRDAKAKITASLEEKGVGRHAVNFKLRDWLFSRQRYWGEPFPVVWKGERHYALSEGDLPVMSPEMDDYEPTGTTDPPLSKAKEWVRYSSEASRETNTMPQWAGSCWYFIRFCDPGASERFVSAESEKYWMGADGDGGVDLYVGGTEHAVLHLLYARFWQKVLHDLGHVSTKEPFQRLINQGMIRGADNAKMSKSLGNVVNPDDVVAVYGADSLRLYEMFMGPLEQGKPWSDRGVEGVYRFLARVWRLYMQRNQAGEWVFSEKVADTLPDADALRVLHKTIRKVTLDTEALAFNTAISEMMIFVNTYTSLSPRPIGPLMDFLHLLNPYAPHVTEELNRLAGEVFPGVDSCELAVSGWPEYDEQHLVEAEIEIVVQVNGKLKDRVRVPVDASDERVKEAALASEKVAETVAGKELRRTIVVPGKLVNLVV